MADISSAEAIRQAVAALGTHAENKELAAWIAEKYEGKTIKNIAAAKVSALKKKDGSKKEAASTGSAEDSPADHGHRSTPAVSTSKPTLKPDTVDNVRQEAIQDVYEVLALADKLGGATIREILTKFNKI